MSDEQKPKKFSIATLYLCVIIAIPLIVALVYVIIPYGITLRRRYHIKMDMKQVYADAEFTTVKCDMEPIDKAELERRHRWLGDALPEGDFYFFRIYDSEDNAATGYATKDGTVIFDTYAGIYYEAEMIASFKDVVDFEHNFPQLKYYIMSMSSLRYALTHDCTTFEGYRTAGTVGAFTGDGYPVLFVVLNDASEETLKKINKLLADANFDIYIMYAGAKGDFSDNLSDIDFDDSSGWYYPFDDASYEDAILGR